MIYQHLFQAELFYDFYKDFLLKYTLPMHITYIKKKKKRVRECQNQICLHNTNSVHVVDRFIQSTNGQPIHVCCLFSLQAQGLILMFKPCSDERLHFTEPFQCNFSVCHEHSQHPCRQGSISAPILQPASGLNFQRTLHLIAL